MICFLGMDIRGRTLRASLSEELVILRFGGPSDPLVKVVAFADGPSVRVVPNAISSLSKGLILLDNEKLVEDVN